MRYGMAEVCAKTGLKRSTVQRFFSTGKYNKEKDTLSGYNVRKHKIDEQTGKWYFEEEDLEVLWEIRILQSIGLEGRKIKEILKKGVIERHKIINDYIEELEKDICEAKNYINCKMINMPLITDFSYDENRYIDNKLNDIFEEKFEKLNFDIDIFNEEEANAFYELIYTIDGVDDKEDINEVIVFLDNILKKMSLIKSVRKFYAIVFLNGFFNEMSKDEVFEDIEEREDFLKRIDIAKKTLEENYNNNENILDKYYEKVNEIADYGMNDYEYYSNETQSVIKALYEYYYELFPIKEFVKTLLESLKDLYSDPNIVEIIDNKDEKGFCWYFRCALEYYLENNLNNEEVQNAK